jgi:hypothetical protein
MGNEIEIEQAHDWELEPHYGITHYSSDVRCPYCHYAMHFADEVKVGLQSTCRGCLKVFVIGDRMEKQPTTHNGAVWICASSDDMRGAIESRKQFVERNLAWWKETKHLERKRRLPHYQRFLEFGGIHQRLRPQDTLAEVGPGPFGGIIQQCNLPTCKKYFIDYILADLVRLGFISWPGNAVYVNAPAESIPLETDSVDMLISCNTLDHGWDVYNAIRECVRISKRCALSFDCRGDSEQQRRDFADDLDHHQLLHFDEIKTFVMDNYSAELQVSVRDTGDKAYPVAYIESDKERRC